MSTTQTGGWVTKINASSLKMQTNMSCYIAYDVLPL